MKRRNRRASRRRVKPDPQLNVLGDAEAPGGEAANLQDGVTADGPITEQPAPDSDLAAPVPEPAPSIADEPRQRARRRRTVQDPTVSIEPGSASRPTRSRRGAAARLDEQATTEPVPAEPSDRAKRSDAAEQASPALAVPPPISRPSEAGEAAGLRRTPTACRKSGTSRGRQKHGGAAEPSSPEVASAASDWPATPALIHAQTPIDQPSASGAAEPAVTGGKRRGIIAGLAVAVLLLGAVTVGVTATRPPAFDRAYLIVLGQAEYDTVVGNPEAPFLNGLIRGYGLAANYSATTHPAAPNYLVLLTGSTLGVTEGGADGLTAPSVLDQLEAMGRTWRVYAQNYPGDCFAGDRADGGVDLLGSPGTYERARNAALAFSSIRGDPVRCANILPLSGFDPAAADLQIILPNDVNGMAGGRLADADQFLRALVPTITSRADFPRSVVFITWAEGTSGLGGGGRVPLIVISPRVGPAFVSPAAHTHRAVPRTIEDVWGLGCLPGTCEASNLDEFLTP
jgi:hypothetical protein